MSIDIEILKGNLKDENADFNYTKPRELILEVIEQQQADNKALKALAIFMCETWVDMHNWSAKHFTIENCGDYPMMQTTQAQNTLRKISKIKYDKKLINNAISLFKEA